MGVTNLVNMQMTVPDPRAGTIYLVDVNATNAAPPTLQISLVDGQLVLAAPDRTQRMVRGTDSDW